MSSSDPYRTPATSTPQPAAGGLGGYLDGSQPLWKAFWLVYMLGSVVIFGVLSVGLRSILIRTVHFFEQAAGLSHKTTILLLVTPPLYGFVLLSLVVVWRCAGNTSLPLWTWLARLVVILNGLWAVQRALEIFS